MSADGLTGDGSGVLTQLPHKLFMRELAAQGITLEDENDLGVGLFFVGNAAPADELFALVGR